MENTNADVHYKTNSQTSPDRYALRAQPIPGNHLVWRLGEHSWTSAIPVVSGDIPSLFSVLHDVVDVPWFEDTGFVPETVELSVEDHDIIRDLRGMRGLSSLKSEGLNLEKGPWTSASRCLGVSAIRGI